MTSEKPGTATADEAAIRNILDTVVTPVHNLDYEAVRDFIPDDGVFFGSVAPVARGYDELYEKQFVHVWPNIGEFKMLPDTISIRTADNVAWAICLFESSGTVPDGKTIVRQGRMTFIFERRADRWLMLHSHDSLYPVAPS